MNNDERQLIAGLFERMREVRNLDKDHDAEAFIHQSMRENGDSPYLLVQSVLAQETALQQAGARIEELERQLAGLNGNAGARPRASAGFTGAHGAVPAGQSAPWQAQSGQNTASAPWGAAPSASSQSSVPSSNARSSGVPVTNRAAGAVPETGPAAGAGQARRGSGGGFMAQAMTTAAGVAGGMLLANSIGSLFGGGSGASAANPTAASAPLAPPADTTASGTQAAADQQAGADDQSGLQEASADEDWGSDADWGGDDDFGAGDFEL